MYLFIEFELIVLVSREKGYTHSPVTGKTGTKNIIIGTHVERRDEVERQLITSLHDATASQEMVCLRKDGREGGREGGWEGGK